jgi:hypothetical protein
MYMSVGEGECGSVDEDRSGNVGGNGSVGVCDHVFITIFLYRIFLWLKFDFLPIGKDIAV